MLHKLQCEPQILERVLFTDESTFSNYNIRNRQNARILAYKNLQVIVERFNHERFRINLRAEIIEDYIMGPIVLPTSIKSATYLQFIRSHLLNELREIISRHIYRCN
jgi:hypothetical protein